MTASKGRRIGFYLYWGLVFLFWENLLNCILGNYHLEIRRTLWGIAYYSFIFLLLGGLTEIADFLSSRTLRKYSWRGQKHIWLIALLLMVLWGNFYQRLLIHLFSLDPFGFSPIIVFSWLLLVLTAAVVANNMLAQRHQRQPFSIPQISAVSFVVLLCLIISSKTSYFYFFQAPPFSVYSFSFSLVCLGITLVGSWLVLRGVNLPRTLPRYLLFSPIILTLFLLLLSSVLDSTTLASLKQTTFPRSDQPNLLILQFDALRADHVGPPGSNPSLTPTMDQLAAAGQFYPNCHSVTSWTLPAVASLLTSCLPHKLGLIQDRVGRLPDSFSSVTKILKDHGYYTVGLSANPIISSSYGFDQWFDEFQFLPPQGSYQLLLPLPAFLPQSYSARELAYQFGFCSTDLAFAPWTRLNRNAVKAMGQLRERPFFLFMHYMEPHGPYWTKPFHEGLLNLDQIKFAPYLINRQLRLSPQGKAFEQKHETELIATLRQRYLEGVETADQAVKDLRQNLTRLGLSDNTIIIITSDHGEEFMEHGHWDHKNSLYEESVRIPLIIYLPETWHQPLPQPAGELSQVDIAPTLLNLAGISDQLPQSDGTSLLKISPEEKRPIYLVFQMYRRLWQGVVRDGKKLMVIENLVSGQGDTLFYDLTTDPLEKNNLYPCYSPFLDTLGILLREEFNQPLPVSSTEPVRLSPVERERLKALGYIR